MDTQQTSRASPDHGYCWKQLEAGGVQVGSRGEKKGEGEEGAPQKFTDAQPAKWDRNTV